MQICSSSASKPAVKCYMSNNCDIKCVFWGLANKCHFFSPDIQQSASLDLEIHSFSLEHSWSNSLLVSLCFQEGSESQAGVRTRKYLGWVLRSQSGKSWTTPCCRALALFSVRCCLRVSITHLTVHVIHLHPSLLSYNTGNCCLSLCHIFHYETPYLLNYKTIPFF